MTDYQLALIRSHIPIQPTVRLSAIRHVAKAHAIGRSAEAIGDAFCFTDLHLGYHSDIPRAVEYYRIALILDSTNHIAASSLSYALIRIGRHNESCEETERALNDTNRHDWPILYVARAQAHYKRAQEHRAAGYTLEHRRLDLVQTVHDCILARIYLLTRAAALCRDPEYRLSQHHEQETAMMQWVSDACTQLGAARLVSHDKSQTRLSWAERSLIHDWINHHSSLFNTAQLDKLKALVTVQTGESISTKRSRLPSEIQPSLDETSLDSPLKRVKLQATADGDTNGEQHDQGIKSEEEEDDDLDDADEDNVRYTYSDDDDDDIEVSSIDDEEIVEEPVPTLLTHNNIMSSSSSLLSPTSSSSSSSSYITSNNNIITSFSLTNLFQIELTIILNISFYIK